MKEISEMLEAYENSNEIVAKKDDLMQLYFYIQKIEKENKDLNNMLEQADNKNLELIELINKIENIIEDKNITGIEARLLIQEILEMED